MPAAQVNSIATGGLTQARMVGHNDGPPAWNAVSIGYSVFVSMYTVVIVFGLGALWSYRKKDAIRLRGVWLTIASVLAIHSYAAAIFIVYPLNGYYHCNTEFWYMSVFFPLGMAIFQAANARLLAVSKLHQDTLSKQLWGAITAPFGIRPPVFWRWFSQLPYNEQTYIWISVVFLLQIILTTILFFGSRRFNPSIGFFGDHTDDVTLCRTGSEWVPSIAWQVTWSWIIGPTILFRTRKIRDTHFWALQTRIAVISNLPGCPLWVVFLYGGAHHQHFAVHVNAWWPPAFWFAPGLVITCVSAILIPLYDVYKHQEHGRSSSRASSLMSNTTTLRDSMSSADEAKDLARDHASYEWHMTHTLDAIAKFAAERDFTSENVEFWRRVRQFKSYWSSQAPISVLTQDFEDIFTIVQQREIHEQAAHIYFELVDKKSAKIPINIESKCCDKLAAFFQGLTYEPSISSAPQSSTHKSNTKRNSTIAPWSSPPRPSSPVAGLAHVNSEYQSMMSTAVGAATRALQYSPALSLGSGDSLGTINVGFEGSITALPPQRPIDTDFQSPFSDDARADTPTALPLINATDMIHPQGRVIQTNAPAVPHGFSLNLFDEAWKDVDHMLFYNTWPNYVRSLDAESVKSCRMSGENAVEMVVRPAHNRRNIPTPDSVYSAA